uniref:Histone H4 n=1 Tax=Salix viminalis TaxID=40686 RepID=A0A6N2MZU8_SALVM
MDVVYALKRQGRTLYGFGGGERSNRGERIVDVSSPRINFGAGSMISSPLKFEALKDGSEDRHPVSSIKNSNTCRKEG